MLTYIPSLHPTVSCLCSVVGREFAVSQQELRKVGATLLEHVIVLVGNSVLQTLRAGLVSENYLCSQPKHIQSGMSLYMTTH